MTRAAFLTHLAFAAGLFGLSVALTRLMLHQVRIMDMPNQRSSHQSPTPKSGGISLVCTFLVGAAVIFFVGEETRIREDYFIGFVFSAVLVAGISLYDDITRRSFPAKLGTQLLAVFLVLAFGIVVDQLTFPYFKIVALGWWGYPLSFLWIIGLTNAYNFMDGLDGLAGGVAVIVSAFFCAITFSQGSNFVYITCYALLAGALGFLVYNFPPARIFMGDVGSAFLGFAFAVLAIIAARYDRSHTSFLVMPLLLFNFVYDAFFTFIRRLLRGERVLEGHRTHLYQLLNRTGWSHRAVSLFHYGVCVLQGIAAIWMVNIIGGQRMLVFLPFLAFQVIYTIVVIRRAREAKLL
ncbi:MAG: UDP-phosphate alpha-N-acetylglucosaminyl 1-phosphate transferase [Betaproteobacteria bacterium RIFCSPLOWO2_02_FULL_67_26]|nr:MAG: UDP-phosphate alpha-N-acetylglucosaminyl 1-phosphate transferase [Betaproteobacteria bacterium RIFCSPLOWO2_02_FULL_67_26]